MSKLIIKSGEVYGRLTVVKEVDSAFNKKGNRIRKFLMTCSCGNQTIVMLANFIRGHTTSCGCAHKEITRNQKTNLRHGLSGHALYRIHADMKSRCYNSKHPEYKNYGARGIDVCNEWLNDFKTFYNWAMSSGYRKNLDIDRRDNDSGYSPENCHWVSRFINTNNRRVTKYVIWNGEKISLAILCKNLGLNRTRIYQRITRDGFTLEDAIKIPLRNYRNK